MKSEDRKKITANELYLNECMSILYTKIRATGLDMFDENGNISTKHLINVENYNHGTVTYFVSPNSIRVNYDGTNFQPTFKMDEKNGGFAYKLKPLGMEYLCSDRALDEMVHEKKIMRTVGECKEYFRYLACGTFFILLEYCSKDEHGKTMIINEVASGYNDEQLIQYLYEAHSLAMEQEGTLFGDADDGELTEDEARVAEDMLSSVNMDELKAVVNKQLTRKDEDEIDAYSSDDEYPDICDIDFELVDILKDKLTDEPYCSQYPANIEDFDYQEYIREIKSGDGEEIYPAGQVEETDDSVEVDGDSEFDDQEYDEDSGELDETSTGDLYSETDTITDGEGFIEDSVYTITRNDEVVEGQAKCDILDDVTEGLMDLDQQVMTLKDYYWDIYTELRKIREIILRRKERVSQGKGGQSGADVGDTPAGDDIDNR